MILGANYYSYTKRKNFFIAWLMICQVRLQIERSSVGGASRNGARLPGLEPGRAQKKKTSSPAVTGFGGIFSQLEMKYGGTVISPGRVFF
jgi:hypothetical protein